MGIICQIKLVDRVCYWQPAYSVSKIETWNTSLQATAKYLIIMISALRRWDVEPLSQCQIRNSWQSAYSGGKIWEMSCRLTQDLRLQFLFCIKKVLVFQHRKWNHWLLWKLVVLNFKHKFWSHMKAVSWNFFGTTLFAKGKKISRELTIGFGYTSTRSQNWFVMSKFLTASQY
jgi:hypothetical protein